MPPVALLPRKHAACAGDHAPLRVHRLLEAPGDPVDVCPSSVRRKADLDSRVWGVRGQPGWTVQGGTQKLRQMEGGGGPPYSSGEKKEGQSGPASSETAEAFRVRRRARTGKEKQRHSRGQRAPMHLALAEFLPPPWLLVR
ncbi:hypothetical protein HPB47_010798 [Ixodes persulcatus]|uniref:Uncharacterized protein n=1 Tax=Ixodes persulcatus TaxID=34615 RepID=A0AC60NYA8_IXOPE|nr:hypothetical protein HPB47_010798 [Ixodes persulcatus]